MSQSNLNENKHGNPSGISNIINHRDRKHDSIPFRLDFVKDILKSNHIEPLIDLNNLETEAFIHPNGYCCNDVSSNDYKENFEDDNSGGTSTSSSHDIRQILGKKQYDFQTIIREIGGKLVYVKSGSSGHTFKGIIVTDQGVNINYAVKVVAYPKKAGYGDINDARRPENAELLMIRLLSYFVIKKQTPHIVLPLRTFYTSIDPFINLMDGNYVDKNNTKYKEFVEKYKKGLYHDTVSILISEWANKGDLLDFIRRNYKEFTTLHWKAIFFQIISMLAVIQSKFPSFRHNDMKANNILIHRTERRGTIFSYVVCRKKYFVPDIGYKIKLWDFDFACIPGIVDNEKVYAEWTDRINVRPVQNRYYDIHYFFNTLIKKGFFPELLTDSSISKDVKNFINRIVPPKFQRPDGEVTISDRGRILINDEYAIPNDILQNDPFFEEFRNYKPKKNNNPTDNYNINNNAQTNRKSPINKNMTSITNENRKRYILSK